MNLMNQMNLMSPMSLMTNMRRPAYITALILVALLAQLAQMALTPKAEAYELTGQVSAQVRAFQSEPLYQDQQRNNASFSFEAEYYQELGESGSITFAPFARLDSADDDRTHMDIRELSYLHVSDTWELKAGISKVFWGVTEFAHLVDIINQDDGVESPDGEDKLGQPMVHLSVPGSWGVLDLFVLPYFRERTFPGQNGRLRPSIVIDTDNPSYEDPDEENHIDLAARYSHSVGILDFGLYHFSGTGREPTLVPEIRPGGLALVPYYVQIEQSGLDAQLVAGQWLLKFEGIRRTWTSEDFYAASGGFEYTFSSLGSSSVDLGVILEYVRDDRGEDATTPFNNDIMAALRLAMNDQAGTELLAGVVEDMDNSSRIVSLEASRRLGDNMKATFEARAFLNSHEDDLTYDARDDDYIQLELTYYF